MKKEFAILILTIAIILGIEVNNVNSQTYCNPLDINYGYSAGKPVKPDISDPTILLYKDNYFLFTSNAAGYWYSSDLLSWKFISAAKLSFKNNEPTAAVIGDWVYYFKSLSDTILRSNDPINGKWEVYATNSALLSIISDFAVFADTDGRVFCYYGCSNNDGVMVRELDPNNQLNPIGVPTVCRRESPPKIGQKKNTENANRIKSYNVKGSWMNKYNGKYYYQSSELNTELNNYGDAVYVSDSPIGPFTYAANNPFSYRPDGFVSGAGNGSTFTDKYGNWWHIATMTAPKNIETHARLGLFQTGFDNDGNLVTNTDFGDFPMRMTAKKNDNVGNINPDWLLLSFNVTAKASSSISTFPATLAFDENIGTYWSAQTGEKGEWLMADLGSVCSIKAFQVNFAEHKSSILNYDSIFAYQYLVEYSLDKKIWKKLSDKTANTEYQPNPYEEVITPVETRYLKITNYRAPSGTFAISGFRIFGSGIDRKPQKIGEFRAIRDYRDLQAVKISWKKQANTTGYNIRYGIDKNKLYHSYQVFKNTRLTIHCPDKNTIYWFEIDAFNNNGVTQGKPQLCK